MKRKRTTRLYVSLAIGSLLFGLVLAGTLDPPGPPAPTMVTLQQIHDRLGGMSRVARTGQTGCWEPNGASIPCSGTGQDGEYQAGASVSPRFTDTGDGTVKDNLTGRIWLKNANCFGLQSWTTALAVSNTLANGSCGLTDGSAAGAWRLPNVRELYSLIDFGQSSPPLLSPGHPFVGVVSAEYWSSSTYADGPTWAWMVALGYGHVGFDSKTDGKYMWPVRGGQ